MESLGTVPGPGAGRGRPIGPVAGLARTALRFDGRDDYALVRDFTGLPTSAMTAAAWVKVSLHKSYNRILSHKWVGHGWNLYTDGAGVARFGIGQNNLDYTASKIIFRERWHYVVGTYDGAHIQIYVDGVPGSRTEFKNASLDGVGYLSIGGAEWDPFAGQLDDVRLWNRARSLEQVRVDMVQQPDPSEPEMVGFWKFDEVQGHTARDASSFGNHAELGTGRRAPQRVQSGAAVSVACTQPGVPISLLLDGILDDGARPRAYVVTLPDHGSLMQHTSQAGLPAFEPIEAAPTEIRSPAQRVLYTPPPTLPTPYCATFEYRVHDGKFTSRETASVMVEVVAEAEACSNPQTGLGGCWGKRTQVSIVHARAPPPQVSVVVPLYNQGHLLRETLDSVVAQTMSDWEVIVVDDGSTDGTREVARNMTRAYAERGHRVRFTTKENGGLADARNFGLRLARAEMVLPLDGDDLIVPTFLEQALRIMHADNATNLVIANLKGFGAWEYSWRLPEYDALDLRYTNMFHCSALFRKSLWAGVPDGYPTTTLFGYEDWAFWIFAEALVGISPKYIAEEQFLYRIRADSMHQTLLQNQEYSLASVRMLHPDLFPVELLLAAHSKFVSATQKVQEMVVEKVSKFPWHPMVHLMSGLISEGMGSSPFDGHAQGYYWEDALASYEIAVQLAHYNDWQPRWRLGLLQQRYGRFEDGNRTMAALMADFTGLEEAYSMHQADLRT